MYDDKGANPAINAAFITGGFMILAAIITGVLALWEGVFATGDQTSTVSLVQQTQTAEAQQTLAATPIPTSTLGIFPTVVPPVMRNADWTPVERNFELRHGGTVTMVLVPPGRFSMGSNSNEIEEAFQMCQRVAGDEGECERSWFEDEAPNHTQIFAESFWIDRTEVTRARYQQCVDAGVCEETPASFFSTQDNQPINRVTWFQARTYCEWREARLPTEAEWEYAARGPDNWVYPWGDEWNPGYTNWKDRSPDQTVAVGNLPQGASWVGAMDMSGNVSEWTSSFYKDYPYDQADGRERDMGDSTDILRVLRGGAFDNEMSALRTASRIDESAHSDLDSLGFRCARSID